MTTANQTGRKHSRLDRVIEWLWYKDPQKAATGMV